MMSTIKAVGASIAGAQNAAYEAVGSTCDFFAGDKTSREAIDDVVETYQDFRGASEGMGKLTETRDVEFRDIESLTKDYALLRRINSFDPIMREKSDGELGQYTAEFKERLSRGEKLNGILPEAYAVVREAARRIYGNNGEYVEGSTRADPEKCKEIFGEGESPKFGRHYDEQIIGGIEIHKGNVAEMCTGEGKTLVATLPAYLNALTGKGVHVTTVNDYLAQRDAKWMAPLFNFLGLSVGVIHQRAENGDNAITYTSGKDGKREENSGDLRKAAYNCDITYGTCSEFGFDFLRDNLAKSLEDKVQRGHNFAIIDEVDNILIDEARTPLIISGMGEADRNLVKLADEMAKELIGEQRKLVKEKRAQYERQLKEFEGKENLTRAEKKEKRKIQGKLGDLSSKLFADYDEWEEESPNYFQLDPKDKSIHIDDAGFAYLEGQLSRTSDGNADGGFGKYDPNDIRLIGLIATALRANIFYRKDRQYVVEKDEKGKSKVIIVDENTGRRMPSRRWKDGLHEAVEAKEKTYIKGSSLNHAAITLPFYFAKYGKKAGMTGTAKTDIEEFREIYRMNVVTVPTHKPVARVDNPDVLYLSEDEKFDAVADEIIAWHSIGRPVLVGTTSVENTRKIAKKLEEKGFAKELYQTLNAEKKNAAREAEIVAKAGKKGAITIATNMAGRGTDISLEEGVENIGAGLFYNPIERRLEEAEDDESQGGLVVLGTARHNSRRVDNQLRGRAGRQGDPGMTRFHTSLDDELFLRLAPGAREYLKTQLESGPIESGFVAKCIAYAQSKVSERDYFARKRLFRNDAVLDQQRNIVYKMRDTILSGDNAKLSEYMSGILGRIVESAESAAREKAEEMVGVFQAVPQIIGQEFVEWYSARNCVEGTTLSKQDVAEDLAKSPGIVEREIRDYALMKILGGVFRCDVDIPKEVIGDCKLDKSSIEKIRGQIKAAYEGKKSDWDKAVENPMRRFEERARTAFLLDAPAAQNIPTASELESKMLLNLLDAEWSKHLTSMEWLDETVWLRGYAQKDPKQEYLKEGWNMFDGFVEDVVRKTMANIMRAQPVPVVPLARPVVPLRIIYPIDMIHRDDEFRQYNDILNMPIEPFRKENFGIKPVGLPQDVIKAIRTALLPPAPMNAEGKDEEDAEEDSEDKEE